MDFSKSIPASVANVEELTRLLNFWNEEVCKKEQKSKSYIYSVVLGTEGEDAGKNLVWFKDSDTEPLAPTKVKTFPMTLSDDDRRKAILEFEDANKVELRSSAIVILGGEKKWAALFDPAPVEKKETPVEAVPGVRFEKTRARVSNRGMSPAEFLQELVKWGKAAPPEIFEDKATSEPDVYASVKKELGPYGDLLHRKACMLEVMRVLAGFESSWKWNTGRDTTNAAENSADTISAGPFQVSANSLGFGEDLRDLVAPHDIERSVRDGAKFQDLMKTEHLVAFEYIARLLRHTIRHNGPVKRSEIDEWLSKDSVEEFKRLLTA